MVNMVSGRCRSDDKYAVSMVVKRGHDGLNNYLCWLRQ